MVESPAFVASKQDTSKARSFIAGRPGSNPARLRPDIVEQRRNTGPAAPEPSDTSAVGTDAPLVDIALASVRQHEEVSSSVAPDEELEALRAEVSPLRESVSEPGSASVRFCAQEAKAWRMMRAAQFGRSGGRCGLRPGGRLPVRRCSMKLPDGGTR